LGGLAGIAKSPILILKTAIKSILIKTEILIIEFSLSTSRTPWLMLHSSRVRVTAFMPIAHVDDKTQTTKRAEPIIF
jgi:hypothetical protein